MKFVKKAKFLFALCVNVVARSTQNHGSLSHLALAALLTLLWCVFCFSHPYNSSQRHQNVRVHIGITRQFHSGRCLMFLVLRLSLSYRYYGDILMLRVLFESIRVYSFGRQTMVAM